jgi:hypothetical protein
MASELAIVGPGGRIQLDRRTIELLAEMFVGFLDIIEPEPDCETTDLEDDFVEHVENGPGCEVADAGGHSWIERKDQTRDPFAGHGPSTIGAHEDAEDEDSDCGDDEGEPNFAKPPRGYGPGCTISDSDYGGEEAGEADDAAYLHHPSTESIRLKDQSTKLPPTGLTC